MTSKKSFQAPFSMLENLLDSTMFCNLLTLVKVVFNLKVFLLADIEKYQKGFVIHIVFKSSKHPRQIQRLKWLILNAPLKLPIIKAIFNNSFFADMLPI